MNQTSEQFSIKHLYQDEAWKEEFMNKDETIIHADVLSNNAKKGNIVIIRKKIKFLPIYYSKITFGPVIDYNSCEDVENSLEAIISIAKKNKDIYVHVHPFTFGNKIHEVRETFTKKGFKRVKCYIYEATILIDLQKEETEIFNSFERRGREAIRQSEKRGITSGEEKITHENLEMFYKLYSDTCRRTGMIPEEQDKIFKVVKFYNQQDKVFLFFARYENIPICAFIAFKCSDCLSLIYQGSDYSGNYQNKRPANNLYWYTIKWAKHHGYKWFDLAGVTLNPSLGSKKEGIYLYKRQFGGTIYELPGNFEYVNRPLIKLILDICLPLYSKLALSFQRKRMLK